MKKRVIVCGYPKSGNTWLARLTAEIIGCPVVGFWCLPFHKDEAVEGHERESEFQCFKAHHPFDQLTETLNIYGNGTEKIIYIYRDPRSVVVSASHYFEIGPQYPWVHKVLSCFPKGLGVYNKALHSRSYIFDTLSKGLIEGTAEGAWMREPWEKHIMGYRDKENALLLSYESLKKDPFSCSRKISRFLSISRTDSELLSSIQTQSFNRKKSQFQADGLYADAKFLRKGETDSWRSELPLKNLRYIEKKIGRSMRELGYELSFGLESGRSGSWGDLGNPS